MLKSRQEGIERVNNMFGTEIKVSLNEKFDIVKVTNNYGGGLNENEQYDTI